MASNKHNGARQQTAQFLQQMHDPSIVRGLESRMNLNDTTSLVQVSWKLQCAQGDDNDNKKAPNGDATNDKKASSPPIYYPPFDYLQLRKIQNEEWATDRLKQGIHWAKSNEWKKAEEAYKQGLDLVPTHAPLLVAYGALCHNVGRTQEAIDKLQHAIQLEPNVANGKAYLNAILKPKTTTTPKKRQAGSVSRSETAMQDVIMERSFLLQDNTTAATATNGHEKYENEKYPLLHDETKRRGSHDQDESLSSTSDRRHGRRRKKEKKRRRSSSSHHHRKSRSKRKRKHHDFSGSDDEGSVISDEESHSGRHRKRRKHHRHASRRPSDTDETSEEANRRRRRRKKKRRKHRDYSSDDSVDSRSERKRRKARRKEHKRRHSRSREPQESRANGGQDGEHEVSGKAAQAN